MHALGYSIDSFTPGNPGRLCRGRERWVDSFPMEDEELTLGRVVVTGSEFTDETARDALRGIPHAQTTVGAVVHALADAKPVLAYCEDGHPRLVPETTTMREDLAVTKPSGRVRQWSVRWTAPCSTPEEIDAAAQGGASVFVLVSDPAATPTDELLDSLHLLAGHGTEGPPERRFQPAALPELLETSEGVVLLHLDKHGPVVARYDKVQRDHPGDLDTLAESSGALLVPFAIPPMLARWDRALWELRQDWDEQSSGPFPVPPAPEGASTWGRRRRRSRSSSNEE